MPKQQITRTHKREPYTKFLDCLNALGLDKPALSAKLGFDSGAYAGWAASGTMPACAGYLCDELVRGATQQASDRVMLIRVPAGSDAEKCLKALCAGMKLETVVL